MKDRDIQFVRKFNRFYTNILGLLDQHLLHTAFSLPEARILYELSHHQPCTASDILSRVKIDKGYLSRVLTRFQKKGLLIKKKSKKDGRAAYLQLTGKGRREFEKINQASFDHTKAIIKHLSTNKTIQLVRHMHQIRRMLDKSQTHENITYT